MSASGLAMVTAIAMVGHAHGPWHEHGQRRSMALDLQWGAHFLAVEAKLGDRLATFAMCVPSSYY